MRWIGISGGWRKTNEKIEHDVRAHVREIYKNGNGIVTGGALGVDSIALDEALKLDPKAAATLVVLPSSLGVYAKHYRTRADEGVITSEQAETLIGQLTDLTQRNAGALRELSHRVLNKETYYDRNSAVVDRADELIAFRIKTNDSPGLGTSDTVEKARSKGIPVKVIEYDLRGSNR